MSMQMSELSPEQLAEVAELSGLCTETHELGDDGQLDCDLPFEHDGEWHYDGVYEVTWKVGRHV